MFQHIRKEYNVDTEDDQDAFVEAINEVYERHNIDVALHVWENGFEPGDTSEEELQALVDRIGGGSIDELWSILDGDLENIYRFKLEQIHERNEMADELREVEKEMSREYFGR